MLAAYPINTLPLAVAAGQHEDDVIILPPGRAIIWQPRVTLDGLDVTQHLTGTLQVDREEGAAGVANIELYYPSGTAPEVDVAGAAIAIDYIDSGGSLRLFTGFGVEPRWDAVRRVLHITCSDMLQSRVENMSRAAIDSLTGGLYSADVFGEVDSHWDYAQDRMATRPASLDCTAHGAIRVTAWAAQQQPQVEFKPGTTVYESISVELAQKEQLTSRIELSLTYRYKRDQQATDTFTWTHPATGGSWGISGFCNWRQLTTELPDTDMVLSAVSSAGLVPTRAEWARLPETAPNLCDMGPWINNNRELLLAFEIDGMRRWSQSVTEQYQLVLELPTPAPITSRTSYSCSIEAPESENWNEINAIGSAGGEAEQALAPGDRDDAPRREAFMLAALHKARTEIIAAHRSTRVSWAAPLTSQLAADLAHTIKVNDQGVTAQGKCTRRIDTLNIETGSALTEITIAVSRGGGSSSTLTPPDKIGSADGQEPEHEHNEEIHLPTQLGGRFTSPPEYDEELDGFSGQYSTVQDFTLPVFPRRLAVTATERAEGLTKALELEATTTYAVGVPNDPLEL